MVKWHNSRIINNNIDPSPQVWNISMAIFTLYMYSIRKVIMYNCHLDTQPGDLGPFKGCYSVTSTERSFSPRSKKTKEAWNIKTSFKRRKWHLLVWIDWNQSRNDRKSGTKSLTKSQTSRIQTIEVQMNHILNFEASVTSYVTSHTVIPPNGRPAKFYSQAAIDPCLVPVRRFPSPSRSIRFSDVSEANGRETTWPATPWPRGKMRPRD